MWKSVKNWLQEWVFNIYKWKWGRSRWIAYFENYLQKWLGDRYGEIPAEFPARFPTRISFKHFPQDFPARFSHKIFHKHFPQDFLARNFPQGISHKNFLQDFPKLDPDWLAPHHPIPNAKFPPITAFLNLAFSPPPCLTRISCKNFPQDFPTTISCKIFQQEFPARFPKLDPDWLAPHHPIPNAKFPPITALLIIIIIIIIIIIYFLLTYVTDNDSFWHVYSCFTSLAVPQYIYSCYGCTVERRKIVRPSGSVHRNGRST